MGASAQKSSSSTTETEISKTQAAILKERESLFNSYFWPTLTNAINSTDINSKESQAQMNLNAQQVNSAYNTAQQQTNQQLAQQGLLGTSNGSGAQAALQAQNNRAKASALANAYYNQVTQNNSQKSNYLQLAASMMPTTVNQIGYGQEAKSSGWSVNLK